jgi:SAM-dependent methyltransferase
VNGLGYTGPARALEEYAASGQPGPQLYRWRTECRLCSGPLDRLLRLADTPPANELVDAEFVASGKKQDTFPLVLARCSSCGHVQLQTVVDPARMFSEYFYQSGTSPVFRGHLRALAESVFPKHASDLVVEVGSNDGTLLSYYADEYKVVGVDPARNLAEAATARNLLTYADFFTRRTAQMVRDVHGAAALVLALNVFAHADDLHEIVEGVKLLLADDGRFVVEVAYLPDMLRDGTFDMVYAEHTSFHHLSPLVEFFGRHGLSLYDAHHVDSQGGSIRCFVDRGTAPTDRLRRMLADELTVADQIAEFLAQIEAAKVELTELLAKLKAEGRTIAAFGAPAKSTTLLHHFGIGRETIDWIVEENPLKQGKFTPGTNIPIVGTDALTSRRPDYVLCLAWNFSKDIVRRYEHLGLAWIVPLPRLQVIG